MVVDATPHDGERLTSVEPDEAVVQAVEEADQEASAEVMSLLTEGVPLALLADLVNPDGPASPEILEDEGLPDVAWWEQEEHRDEPVP